MAMLSLQQMRDLHACEPGLEWWAETFGETDVDYSVALDTLVAGGHDAWARWLLNAVTPSEDALVVTGGSALYLAWPGPVFVLGDIAVDGCVLVGGPLVVQGSLTAKGIVDVWGDMRTGDVSAELIYARGRIYAGIITASSVRSGSYIIADSIKADTIIEWAHGQPTEPRRLHNVQTTQ